MVDMKYPVRGPEIGLPLCKLFGLHKVKNLTLYLPADGIARMEVEMYATIPDPDRPNDMPAFASWDEAVQYIFRRYELVLKEERPADEPGTVTGKGKS